MPTLTNQLPAAPPNCVSPRLLGTALAGLLCLATAGCSGTQQETPGASGSSGTSPTAGAADTSGAAGTAVTANGGTATGHAGEAGEAGTASSASGGTASAGGVGGNVNTSGGAVSGSGGVSAVAGAGGATAVAGGGAGGTAAESPHITSSTAAGALTADDFKALCDQRGGTVEVMPHCGGFATAKGVSYDAGTQLLSEHTCMGANTCGGWNCIID